METPRIDVVTQVFITILGITTVLLLASKNKYGCIFALAVQPFWFIASYRSKQWGVFLMTFVYTVSWAYGIYVWFLT
jgi:hypothetical protein